MKVRRRFSEVSHIKHYPSSNGLGNTQKLNRQDLRTIKEELYFDFVQMIGSSPDKLKDFTMNDIEPQKGKESVDCYTLTEMICDKINIMFDDHSKYIHQIFDIYCYKKDCK